MQVRYVECALVRGEFLYCSLLLIQVYFVFFFFCVAKDFLRVLSSPKCRMQRNVNVLRTQRRTINRKEAATERSRSQQIITVCYRTIYGSLHILFPSDFILQRFILNYGIGNGSNNYSPLKCFGQHTNSTPENNEIPHGSNMAKLRICIPRSWQAAAPV